MLLRGSVGVGVGHQGLVEAGFVLRSLGGPARVVACAGRPALGGRRLPGDGAGVADGGGAEGEEVAGAGEVEDVEGLVGEAGEVEGAAFGVGAVLQV